MSRWAIAGVCMVIGIAHAQPATAQEQADALFAEGRRLSQNHEWAAACTTFEAAIKLDAQAAGTMLNLGLCNEELHRYATALVWFRRAQARAHEAGLPDHQEAAEAHTLELASKVSSITLQLAAPPPDVEVAIDGKRIDATQLAHVEVDAGLRIVEVHAPGKVAVRLEITLAEAENKNVSVQRLIDLDGADATRGMSRTTKAVWFGIGGVVAIGASIGLSLWAQSDGNSQVGNQSRDRSIQRYLGTPLFVGGLGLFALAGYELFVKPAHRTEAMLAPVFGPGQVGLALTGGF